MDEVGKAALAVSHAFIAANIAAVWPTPLGVSVAAFIAYILVFYE